MDDFTTPNPEAVRRSEAVKRELQRRSLDTILVHNFTPTDYRFKYDGYVWTVPAANKDIGFGKGNQHFPRYLAHHYIKHKTDELLTEKASEAVRKENERRIKNGMAEMTRFQEQPAFEANFKTNRPELRRPLIEKMWVGIVREYGADLPDEEEAKPTFSRPVDEEILSQIGNRIAPQQTEAAVDDVKNEQLKGVSK